MIKLSITTKEVNRVAQKVTSTDIKLALKEFHNGKPSYFITECKTCSTYFPDPQGLLKFDGLAITKSYTKPNIIGYEIKVSRNDFLQDNKWHLYLQYCNEFYFVVPKGLVKKEELPDHVGLIYFNPDTKGLRTVKKALYRQIEEPVGVYKYIIFSRLEEDRIPFYNDRAEYCKDYLEDKVVKSVIGQRLRAQYRKSVSMTQSSEENAIYGTTLQPIDDIRGFIISVLTPDAEYDESVLNQITEENIQEFYDTYHKNMEKMAEEYGKTSVQKKYLEKKYNEIKLPVEYESYSSWDTMIMYVETYSIILAIIVGFICAGIFADDFQTKADAVFFSTKYGRTKAVKTKILAGVVTTVMIYCMGIILR